MERHLAAILAADMVGYSRLMAADEPGTIRRQKDHYAAHCIFLTPTAVIWKILPSISFVFYCSLSICCNHNINILFNIIIEALSLTGTC